MLRRIGKQDRPAEQRHRSLIDKLAANFLVSAWRSLQQVGMFQCPRHQVVAEDVIGLVDFRIGRRAARNAAGSAHMGKVREGITAKDEWIEERNRHVAAGLWIMSSGPSPK